MGNDDNPYFDSDPDTNRVTVLGAQGGKDPEDYDKRAGDAFKDYFGTKSGPKAGQAMIQKQAVQYMKGPETFGISEAEKQAAADKAAAAAAAGTAGALAQGTREMMGGGTTGYAAQAMRQAVAPTRQGAASASQQAMEASKQMIEAKGKELYGELTGKPYMTVAGQIAAAAGQQAVESGVDLLADYAGQQLLGEPDDPDTDTDVLEENQ